MIEEVYVVACHYAMKVWPRSHYNSWQLFDHSHGTLEPIGKQWDVGVDDNNLSPVSFEELRAVMRTRPDNADLVRNRERSND
jgi:calcineurin-like phosphoesterase family protein